MNPSAASLSGPNAAISGAVDSACKGTLINDEYHFGQQGKIADCGNEIIYNATHIVVKSSIQGVAGAKYGGISRQRRLKVDLACVFERLIRVDSGPILTSLYHFTADLGETTGNFDLSIDLFKDDAFRNVFQSYFLLSAIEPF